MPDQAAPSFCSLAVNILYQSVEYEDFAELIDLNTIVNAVYYFGEEATKNYFSRILEANS